MPKITPYRGVTVTKRARGKWRLRYTDPDTEATKWETVSGSKDDAKEEATRISKRLTRRKGEIKRGAVKRTDTPLAEAIELFYSEALARRSEATHEAYQLGTNRLLDWASRNRIKTTDDLNSDNLMSFRAEVMKAPKQYSHEGTKQGGKVKGREYRSVQTCNKELRAVKRALGYLILKRRCSKLTTAEMHAALKLEPTDDERRDYLRPNELRKLLEACERHDGATYQMTRKEKNAGESGGTPRHDPISEFVVFIMLTGMRRSEALKVEWSHVDLNALDPEGRKVGVIAMPAAITKTKKRREVDLAVSPALRRLLASMKLRSGGRGRIFESLTEDTAIKAMNRLRKTYGAPKKFSYQALRVTCSTYLTNATGIYGGASHWLSAKQLGHSVTIAEKHYAGVARVSQKHRTLEAAMQIEPEVVEAIERMAA